MFPGFEWRVAAAVAAGGAIGALGRYGLSFWISRWAAPGFPWGTFVVNVSGSLFLGVMLEVLEGVGTPSVWRAFAVVGVAGAFTTFSTFSHETMLLLAGREWGRAVLYTSGSILLGLLALILGMGLASFLPTRG